MNDSILNSVKKKIGIGAEYQAFDPDLVMVINSVFSILTQLGVGPETGFSISGDNETWDMYTTEPTLEMVKDYVALKTKMSFDPPTSSVLADACKERIAELEWRLNVAVDPAV